MAFQAVIIQKDVPRVACDGTILKTEQHRSVLLVDVSEQFLQDVLVAEKNHQFDLKHRLKNHPPSNDEFFLHLQHTFPPSSYSDSPKHNQDMSSINPLGRLRYSPGTHSWTIELGEQLGILDLILHYHNNEDPIHNRPLAASNCGRKIESLLQSHGIRYSVSTTSYGSSDYSDQVESDVLDLLRIKGGYLDCFMLLGSAGFWSRLVPQAKDGWKTTFQKAALLNLQSIQDRCPDSRINVSALSQSLVIDDHLESAAFRRKLQDLSRPKGILYIAAQPDRTAHLRLMEERRTLETIVHSTDPHDVFTIEDVLSARIADIGPALMRHRPIIVHFSGHGTKDGLYLEGYNREPVLIDPIDLAELLKLATTTGLSGVVMNACHTDEQARAVAEAVGVAIGMQGSLSDEGAIHFTREFYGALAGGITFAEAFDWAVRLTRLDPKTRNLNPRLFTRGDPVAGMQGPSGEFNSLYRRQTHRAIAKDSRQFQPRSP